MASQRRLSWLVFFGLMGSTASAIPALIPHFASTFSIDNFYLLNAVPLLFAGLFLGILINPLLSTRFGFQQLARFAGILIGIGLFSIAFATDAQLFFLGSFLSGIGFGLAEVSITSQVKKEISDTTKMMTKLNAVFAISAMTTPLLVIAELQLFSSYTLLTIIGFSTLTVGFFVRGISKTTAPINKLKVGPEGILFLAVAGLYVGAESVMAGWASTVLNQATAIETEFTPVASSVFWALIALGRIFSIWLTPKHLSENSALVFWPSAAGLSLIIGSVSFQSNPSAALIAFAISVFAAGPVYGQIIGAALKTAELENANTFTTIIIIAGAAGGFLIPALIQLSPSIAVAGWLSATAMLLVSISFLIFTKAFKPKRTEVMQ